MQISNISHDSECVTIGWEDGRTSQFHHIWLRDNCPTARHPVVGERTLDPVSIPLDIRPQSASLNDDGLLHITWANDGHQSAYSPD
jgi:gamma-butyrobetaine dioxygenase